MGKLFALVLLVATAALTGCATETRKFTIWPGWIEVVVETSRHGRLTPPSQAVEPIRLATPGVSGTWGRGFITNCPTGTIYGPQMPTRENGGQIRKHHPIGGC